MARLPPRIAIIAAFILTALFFTYLSRDSLPQVSQWQPKPEPEAEAEPVPQPRRYETWGIGDLDEVIQISSVRAKTKYGTQELPIKQPVDLILSFTDINLTQPLPNLNSEVTVFQAEAYQVPDASEIIFGMATQLNRLRDALPAIALWASGTNARFVAIVAPAEEGGTTAAEIEKLYQDRDVHITLIENTEPFYNQYVSLLAALEDRANATVKWACIMDDDTFFPSTKRLLDTLKKYNPNEPYYIGGLSENKWNMDNVGYLAFGGAGVFLSRPLLKQLRPYNEKCIAMPDDAGDVRVSRCVATYSMTKFTWEHHLFQMDLHGDVTGFYEAERTRPVSTHHWKSWHFHDMAIVGAVGKVCGNECVLQKYMANGGWKITNGFSIVRYSWNETENAQYIDGAMEHTWADTAWVIPTSWNYTLAPLRPKDESKIQYIIEKVDENETEMTLYYVRRTDGLGRGIIRMAWEK